MGLFGGGNSSSSNATTNNDNRQVLTNTTTSYDLSDHSSTALNNSNNTYVTDGGAFGLVGGAVGAMSDLALAAVRGANSSLQSGYDYADHVFDTATMFANQQSSQALGVAQNAFDKASTLQKDALTTAQGAYAEASRATATAWTQANQAAQAAQGATQAAYADAKGTTDSQKQIILGVLAVAGLMALGTMYKKG
jgi:hypothetical protein